jgi:hypothetical protein
MTSFSERIGVIQPKSIAQVSSMDADLRNGLWSVLHISYLSDLRQLHLSSESESLCTELWLDHFKLPIDEMPSSGFARYDFFKKRYTGAPWNSAYDFIEFIAGSDTASSRPPKVWAFCESCNMILTRELSGFRFVGYTLVQVTDPIEIQALADALRLKGPFDGARHHFETALSRLADRDDPDYSNSIKESISGVESACSEIAGLTKADLSAALREFEAKSMIHPALRKAFESLYGFTSQPDGIRHALLSGGQPPDFDTAKFMLIACVAFVNYLKALIARTPK